MMVCNCVESRPETSFLWFASPLKTFKHILWGRYKWYIITFLILAILIIFLLLMLYSLPVSSESINSALLLLLVFSCFVKLEDICLFFFVKQSAMWTAFFSHWKVDRASYNKTISITIISRRRNSSRYLFILLYSSYFISIILYESFRRLLLIYYYIVTFMFQFTSQSKQERHALAQISTNIYLFNYTIFI